MRSSRLRTDRRIAVAALALAHVAVDASAGGITVLLPIVRERFDLTGAELGALVATYSMSALLAQPVGGHVADRLGLRPVAVVGALVASVGLGLVGLANNMVVLYLLVVVGGLGAAGFHPAAAAVAATSLPGRSDLAVGLFAAGGMIGLAAGPLAALSLIGAHGARATAIMVVPGVGAAAILFAVLPPVAAAVASSRACRRRRSRVGATVAAGVLVALAVTSFNSGIPLWHAEMADAANAFAAGWSLAAFELAGAFGGIAAGWLSARIPSALVAGAGLLLAPAPLAASLVADPGGVRHLALAALGGALANSAFPLLVAAAQQHSPDRAGSASGMLMGLANGIAGVAFVGIAAIADVVGVRSALLTGFSALVPAAALAVYALPRRRVRLAAVVAAPGPWCRCHPSSAAA